MRRGWKTSKAWRRKGPAAELQKVTDFIQNQPSDGKPATERTDAYLGYDESNLYVVLVCFDSHHAVQANLTRREPSTPFDSDDYVEIVLDTFQDQRHAFIFDINPKGVQADGLWTEGQGTDYSWDTLWYSRSKINAAGLRDLDRDSVSQSALSSQQRRSLGSDPLPLHRAQE